MSMPPRYYKVEGKKVTCAEVAERLKISHPAAHKRLSNALGRSARLTWRALGEGAPVPRAQQILRFVIGLGRAAKLDEVVDAIARREPKQVERTHLSMTVAAQLAQLHKAGKLERMGTRCHFTYRPTAEALIDRRKSSDQAAAKPASRVRAGTKPKAEARPSMAQKAKRAPAQTTAAQAQTKRPGEFRIVPNANLTRPRESALGSEQIAADIAAFQARGGRIQRFKRGESSQSIREQNDAYLAARGQGLAKQRAAARIATRAHASNDETLDADDKADVA
jgi:hypothetical protein